MEKLVENMYLERLLYLLDIPENLKGHIRMHIHCFEFDIFTIVDMFEFCKKVSYNMMNYNIIYLIENFNKCDFEDEDCYIYLIFLFHLIDKPLYNECISGNIRPTLNERIKELLSSREIYTVGHRYLYKNLILGKKFTLKKNYYRYVWKRVILYCKVYGKLLYSYRNIVEKRYTPGEAGFLEAKSHFKMGVTK